MKIIRFLVFVTLASWIIGCIPQEDNSVTLSFWTDREMVEEGFNMVYVNNSYIGDLRSALENPVCSDIGLLNYKMKMSEDLHLTVRNVEEDSVEIGIVNLYSVSTGIKIKPSKDSEIFVDQSLDDECTLVYLNWE